MPPKVLWPISLTREGAPRHSGAVLTKIRRGGYLIKGNDARQVRADGGAISGARPNLLMPFLADAARSRVAGIDGRGASRPKCLKRLTPLNAQCNMLPLDVSAAMTTKNFWVSSDLISLM